VRLQAGLSLAQVAGGDVSRTFLFLVEQGRSRPSKPVLALIARRTGKPVDYFLQTGNAEGVDDGSLAADPLSDRLQGSALCCCLPAVEKRV